MYPHLFTIDYLEFLKN
jgi:hypothetical protein